MGCWVSHWNTHSRTKYKQKMFCCEIIYSALAIRCFGQDNRLLGIIVCCIDSQRKVPNPSYFSIISVIAVLLLSCRALLLVSKHLMLGVVCRSPHSGKESSLHPRSFQQRLLFFLPWLHEDHSAAWVLSLLCTASGEYPGQSNSCLALLLWLLLLFVLLRAPSRFGCSFFLYCVSLNPATTPCCNLVLVN